MCRRFFAVMIFALALVPIQAPAQSDEAPLEVFYLGLAKAEILRLASPAATIIISNPTVMDIQLDSPQMGILRGLALGESGLLILDADGKKIVDANVVVSPPEDRHVLVTRDCAANAGACVPQEEFSCGLRCSPIANPAAAATGNGAAP